MTMSSKSMVGQITRQKAPDVPGYIDVLIFLVPALQFIRIKVVGVLNASDILIMLGFFVALLGGNIRIKAPLGRKFLLLCSLWLLSQIVTDLIKHTAFADYARGWSAIGLTFMGFALMFTLLYGSPRRITIYASGLIVGGILACFISPNALLLDDFWKFGMSVPVTWSVLLIASRNEMRGYTAAFLTAAIGLFNFYMGFRNQGEVLSAAAAYVLLTGYLQSKGFVDRELKTWTIIVIACAVFVGMMGIFVGYQYATISGMLGEDARKKFELQSSGDYGVLLGGRVEMLASVPAVYDSPILGHGSFARDPKYLIIEQQTLARLGYKGAGTIDPEAFEEGLIPAHSHLMGSWVSAGILGGLIWAWVWFLACKTLLHVYPRGIKLLPLAAYVAFELLWDILFSPYGNERRLIIPFYAVILMSYIGVAQSHAKVMPVRTMKELKAS